MQRSMDVCIQEYLYLNILIEGSFINAYCAFVFRLCAYLRHIEAYRISLWPASSRILMTQKLYGFTPM